jgi:hypothetical protein
MVSHLGQKIDDHVVLELIGGVKGGYGPQQHDWVRCMPDGTRAQGTGPGGQFRVPKGSALVITDVDWQYNLSSGPGVMQVFRLFVVPLDDDSPSAGNRVFESAVVLGTQGSGGASVSMTTGFVVSSKARLGVDVTPGPLGPPGGLQHAILRGYLISTVVRANP